MSHPSSVETPPVGIGPRRRRVRLGPTVRAVAWAGAYLVLVCSPLLALLIGPTPPGRGLRWDYSMALGFAGLAVLGVQFALTARFRRATAPFGIDVIYRFHRWMAIGGFGLILVHYALLRVFYPAALGPLDPRLTPIHMTAGRVAAGLFLVLIVSSVARKQLSLEYDRWRMAHATLSVAAVVLALVHVAGVGNYTALPWKQALWIGYTGFWVLLVVWVRLVKPWRMVARPWEVVDVGPERGGAWTLTLAPVGHEGAHFTAGQFFWLALRRSPFRAREHPFSAAGSASPGSPVRFTIKELGDFTRTIGSTRKGDRAFLDGPYGVFCADRYPDAHGYGFFAGGVGIAPIMSMLRTMADRGERRRLYLVYANNRWEDVIFREELEELSRRLVLSVTHVLVDPPEGWTGETGFVRPSLLQRALPENLTGLEFFICGPRPMSEEIQRFLQDWPVPLHRIHDEIFDMV